jgi:hypothetical protein
LLVDPAVALPGSLLAKYLDKLQTHASDPPAITDESGFSQIANPPRSPLDITGFGAKQPADKLARILFRQKFADVVVAH